MTEDFREAITDGSFESSFTYWCNDTSCGCTGVIAPESSISGDAHTGSKAVAMDYFVSSLGGVCQTLATKIPVAIIDSLTFWAKNDAGVGMYGSVRVTLTYTDDTTSTQTFSILWYYTQHTVTALTAGKTIKSIKINNNYSVNTVIVDDVSLIYDHNKLTLGPYITIGDINDLEEPIGPINIPYQRVSDTLQTLSENMLESFVPWEWWINYAGEIYLGDERGSDKTALHIIVSNNIGHIVKEVSAKQTAQRVRVVGRGESAEQDMATSDWFVDDGGIEEIGSFYEHLDTEKTLSSKEESDIMAQVILYQNSHLRQEITIKLSNNDYTTNDFDVGDWITVEDTDYGVEAVYRIKTIDNTVDENGGEETYITLTANKTDISNRLASLQKQLEKLQSSSTFLDNKYAAGTNQTKISANEIEDIWEQTASNKWAIELPEDEADDPYLQDCNPWAGRGAIAWACDKDEFEIYAVADDAAGEVFKYEPLLNFSRNPRFTCEFEVDTTGEDRGEWDEGDEVWIRIWQRNSQCSGDPTYGDKYCCLPYGQGGFGFCIQKTATQLELQAYICTGAGTLSVKVANLEYDTKYIIEARMEWTGKVVEFYFGKSDVEETDEWGYRLRAILPLFNAADIGNLCPFHVLMDGSGTSRPAVVIYRWKTQAIRLLGKTTTT